jgi:dipeptidyl aminopeptidase/acylaminoacyl peptidase
MVVKGSSAGGLTALRCLDTGGPFAAAVVAYGVTDLGALAADTHKFESRYMDRLVGPWPGAKEVYDERSPAGHPERVEGAVLLLQGSDDPIVPPDQAERMVTALRARGVRCDHVVFAGEGHGFRRAETLTSAAELEIAFVTDVLGLDGPG